MRIAICNVREFHPQIGGIERVSISIAQELKRHGTEIVFIACLKAQYDAPYSLPGSCLFLPESSDYSKRNVEALAHILQQDCIDVVLNQNAHSLLFHHTVTEACRKAHKPLISALHFSPDSRISGNRHIVNFRLMPFVFNIIAFAKTLCTYWPLRPFALRYSRKLYRQLYEDSEKVVLLSSSYIPSYCQIGGIDEKKNRIAAINNPLSFATDTAVSEKKQQILFCGRLEYKQKRPDRILLIWSQIQHLLPEWELIMVGNGTLAHVFKKLAMDLRLERVTFTGFQNPCPYYKSASILAMTSNHEGFPLVLTEAMQYGCVPVAFDSFTSIRDIIQPERNGILVKPFDLKTFGEDLCRLANTPTLLKDMRSNAMTDINKFTPDRIGAEWLRLLQEAIESYKSRMG